MAQRSSPIHKLALYRRAVQHPEAEAALLARMHEHYRRRLAPSNGAGPPPATRLKEDFCGTAAVAAAWVAAGEDRRAIGVDRHAPTLRWAWREAQRELGPRAADLHLVRADVIEAARAVPRLPRVDLVAALNFSGFYFHTRETLREYFAAARASLRAGGLLVLDAYGGAGAMRPGVQARRVAGDPGRGVPPFAYLWEQRSYDAATARVDCRIHFRFGRRTVRDAFHYDWRLWTLPELTETLREAGFADASIWCDRHRLGSRPAPAPAPGGALPTHDGRYRPIRALPAREDWVAYVVGVK